MYRFLVFSGGRWHLIHYREYTHAFRLYRFSKSRLFSRGTTLHLNQLHQAVLWANKKGYPYRYIQVERYELE